MTRYKGVAIALEESPGERLPCPYGVTVSRGESWAWSGGNLSAHQRQSREVKCVGASQTTAGDKNCMYIQQHGTDLRNIVWSGKQ